MRHQDKNAFRHAAKAIGVWILVRRTNRASLQYIGCAGFIPKPIECKAKTADHDAGKYRIAGLVADPFRFPNSFSPKKLGDAQQLWQEMLVEHGIGQPGRGDGWSVQSDENSPHFGCLQIHGQYAHGDYDLYDIVRPDHPRGNLAAIEMLNGQPHRRGPRFIQVQAMINAEIGVPMIQHGGSAQYADHSEQAIDVFGPHGEETTILNEISVRSWYTNQFQGRQTLRK